MAKQKKNQSLREQDPYLARERQKYPPPPHLTVKPIIYGLLLVCGCLLPSAAIFAHPFAGDACRVGVSVGEGVYSYRLIK